MMNKLDLLWLHVPLLINGPKDMDGYFLSLPFSNSMKEDGRDCTGNCK